MEIAMMLKVEGCSTHPLGKSKEKALCVCTYSSSAQLLNAKSLWGYYYLFILEYSAIFSSYWKCVHTPDDRSFAQHLQSYAAKLCAGTCSFFKMQSWLWAHASVYMYVHGASSWLWSSLSFSLFLESEWGYVYPTFTLKISSSDAADTGSFRPLSSSSSTFKSPEIALLISGPMSCNVRRPA